MTSPGFIHLHTHSAYSLLEGALPLKKLLALAAADEQPAVGVADTANLFGALEFSEKAAEAGIQPIVGCELPIQFEAVDPNEKERSFGKGGVVLIATSETGFGNLSRLVSRAYMESVGGQAFATIDWLREAHEGLICLSGGPEGVEFR